MDVINKIVTEKVLNNIFFHTNLTFLSAGLVPGNRLAIVAGTDCTWQLGESQLHVSWTAESVEELAVFKSKKSVNK